MKKFLFISIEVEFKITARHLSLNKIFGQIVFVKKKIQKLVFKK